MALIATPVDAVGELSALRNWRSKTFDMGNGKRRLIQKACGLVHYHSGVGFEDIDTTIIQQGLAFNVDKAPFQLSIKEGVVGFDYLSRQGGSVSLKLIRLNDVPIGPMNLNPRVVGDSIFLIVTPALEFYIKVRPAQVQIWKLLKNPSAPHNWTWELTENNPAGRIIVQTILSAWDNNNRRPNEGNRADELRPRRRAKVETVVTGKNASGVAYLIREELTGDTVRRDPVTRVKSTRVGEIVYPVLIDQDVSEVIAADGDDGFEDGSTWYNSYGGNYSHFGGDGSTVYHWGVRFQSVAVPAGATIDLANIIANVDGFYGSTPRAITRVYADAVANAAAWGNSSRPSQITKSTAFTTFQPTTTGDKTISVTDQVQEIMDASFVSGNNMRFGILNQDSPPTYKNTQMYDYAQGSANVAELQIDYTEVGVAGIEILRRRIEGD